ncbi:hypothetical protein GQ54DRAFT_299669 [Martensiomyces pterosporus]|nr:hypothetical protein GQ54DRAFT_299669 [Martensiomyces pterosporus]
MSPLTQFVLAKRQFGSECLYAGIYASLHLDKEVGSHQKRQDGGFEITEHTDLFAALLAEQDAALIDMYFGLDRKRREIMDTVLATSTLMLHMQRGRHWQAQLTRSSIPKSARRIVGQLLAQNTNRNHLAEIPGDFAKHVQAAIMLRRPTRDFTDVDSAGAIVAEVLRSGVVPDVQVLETLATTCIRCSSALPALCIYASKRQPLGQPQYALVSLVALRSSMAKHRPRIHYDVLGTFVRNRDLDSALSVAVGQADREMFHVLLSVWTSHHVGDWKGAVRIVKTMLSTLDCPICHSTHHLAIKSMTTAIKHAQSGDDASTILQRTLALHWMLAPRLDTPSIAAIHRLLTLLVNHGRVSDAFHVYRDAEVRDEWTGPKKFVANEAIYAILADGLARMEDLRSITHLTGVATRSGIAMSLSFYTAVICGLTKPQQVARSANGRGAKLVPLSNREHPGPAYLKRTQVAESMFDAMCQYKITRPTKVYHALMYAWALLGQPKKAQSYFDRLGDEQTQDPSAKAAVNEVSWGILMYAYARARNIQGSLRVLGRASEWLSSQNPPIGAKHPSRQRGAAHDGRRSSYLVNMAMDCHLENGDPRSALTLLDESIARYSAEQKLQDQPKTRELAATAADPVTLNLIIRALLSDNQLPRAIGVYESIHAQYNMPETAAGLSLFLRYCLRHSDVAGSFELVGRIMKTGGMLTDRQWLEFMRLCAQECSADVVIYLYEQLCTLSGVDGKTQIPSLVKKYPDVARWVCGALKEHRRDEDADAIHNALAANSAPRALLPKAASPVSTRAQCVALYRSLLREIHVFPVPAMRDKLVYNARFVFELYRHVDPSDPKIPTLIGEGKSQVQWLRGWRRDPNTVRRLVGSEPPGWPKAVA